MATLIFAILTLSIGAYCLMRGCGFIGQPTDETALRKWQQERRWYLILGVLFFAVSIAASINSVRHNAEARQLQTRPSLDH